jgi:nucleotide-binding universal stress UspA family protein
MFKRLVLPLDLTDKHANAVETAAELAVKSAGSVTLLHVIELIPGLPREEDPAFYGRLEQAGKKHLDKIGVTFTKKKIPWQTALLFGHRVEETVRYALEQGSDLLVLTSPTFDPAHPTVGWGSLSFKVSVLSPTPVLLVKG